MLREEEYQGRRNFIKILFLCFFPKKIWFSQLFMTEKLKIRNYKINKDNNRFKNDYSSRNKLTKFKEYLKLSKKFKRIKLSIKGNGRKKTKRIKNARRTRKINACNFIFSFKRIFITFL